MSENTELLLPDPTITLRSLITPLATGALLALTDEEIVAVFAIVSKRSGVPESFTRANWRMIALRISRATSQRNGQTKKTPTS